jgi:alpha-N-acetylglucosaminidase
MTASPGSRAADVPSSPGAASRPQSPGTSRRALLSAAGAIGASVAPLSFARADTPVPQGGHLPDGPAGAFATGPAADALARLLPHHADQVTLQPAEPSDGVERFRVTGTTGRLTVAGTSPAVLLTGVHWYLKYVCGAHLTWPGLHGSQSRLPARLPAPVRPLERTTRLPHRFALNDTSDGYTAPYADWAYWERMIDVLALHGCNEVLVIAGMEAVYHRTLVDAGYTDAEARAWLPSPAYQPWWLLQNLSGYGGPLSAELIEGRARLGRRIADRLRELGMAPVLPGYYGHVPTGFAERHGGDVHVVPQGIWHGFQRPDWLDPRTGAFAEVAAAFYRHQEDVFGPAAHFKMDLLHEGGTAGDVPVPDAARGVERALRSARPDATWVILGWEANPLPVLLDAVDRTRMLIVDGVSDRFSSVTDRERDWGGTPYAFGSIPNFGGRTTIGARTHRWHEKFFAWRDKPGSALVGTAYLPEAADRDPAAFELFSELAWTAAAPDEAARATWFASYADFRYGARDASARAAWQALYDTAYRHHAPERSDPHDSLFAARPDLAANRAAEYAPRALAYDPARFDAALAGLLAVAGPLRGSAAYAHDLTDVARQALEHRSRQYLPLLKAAYERGDLAAFRALAALWLKLLRLTDDMAGTHPAFLLGPWVQGARQLATDDGEREAFERTAKTLLTVWGGRATSDAGSLHDYANRTWHGLVSDFYLPRWQTWLDELADALAQGRAPRPVDWFAVEEPWTRQRKDYPLRPVADPHRTAQRVHDVLAAAPYQGAVQVSADPPVFPPGGRALMRVEFRNVNGLRATGPIDLVLDGVEARAAEDDGGSVARTDRAAEDAAGPPGGGPRQGAGGTASPQSGGPGQGTDGTANPQGGGPGQGTEDAASPQGGEPGQGAGGTASPQSGSPRRGADCPGKASLPGVPAAGSATVSWWVGAPAAPLDRPLRRVPYTLTVTYGPLGADRVRDIRTGTFHEAHPPGAGWRTVSTNDAVFGQLGERFAIDGAGADLWKGTSEFGAVYREGIIGDGGSVTLRVTDQAATGPWARAGIIVRDTLAAAGSPGFVNLAVTPANGVVLSYDTTGDGTLDTYRRLTGITAPVLLRLTRTGTSYTGSCATDDGGPWRTVGTATVPRAAPEQDAGLFMSAANAGSGARGTVEFCDWQVQ